VPPAPVLCSKPVSSESLDNPLELTQSVCPLTRSLRLWQLDVDERDAYYNHYRTKSEARPRALSHRISSGDAERGSGAPRPRPAGRCRATRTSAALVLRRARQPEPQEDHRADPLRQEMYLAPADEVADARLPARFGARLRARLADPRPGAPPALPPAPPGVAPERRAADAASATLLRVSRGDGAAAAAGEECPHIAHALAALLGAQSAPAVGAPGRVPRGPAVADLDARSGFLAAELAARGLTVRALDPTGDVVALNATSGAVDGSPYRPGWPGAARLLPRGSVVLAELRAGRAEGERALRLAARLCLGVDVGEPLGPRAAADAAEGAAVSGRVVIGLLPEWADADAEAVLFEEGMAIDRAASTDLRRVADAARADAALFESANGRVAPHSPSPSAPPAVPTRSLGRGPRAARAVLPRGRAVPRVCALRPRRRRGGGCRGGRASARGGPEGRGGLGPQRLARRGA